MSSKKRNKKVGMTGERMSQMAARILPLVKGSGSEAKRGVHRTRARMAPKLDRTGKVVQDTIAPKVAAGLSTAARRIAPEAPRRHRSHKPTAVAGLTAALGAVAALVRNRRKTDVATPADQAVQDVTTGG